MSAPTDVTAFSGFGPDALAFLEGLEADNSKAYFDAHRATYEEQVRGPLKDLVVTVGVRLRARVVTDVEFEPKVGRSMFRINRDLRFSNDKTPYHPHLDLAWWTGDSPKTSPAFILRIRHDETLTGVGVYGMSGDRLDRWRSAVTGDAGHELDRIVERVTSHPVGAGVSEPSRKRVPRGFDGGGAGARWLLHESLHVSSIHPTPPSITTADFADWVVDRHEELADVHRWLATHVG